MNEYIFFSGISKVYIVELITIIVVVIVVNIICNRKKIDKNIPKDNNLLGRTGSALIEIEEKKPLRPLPIVIFFIGILILVLQYAFEKPQIEDNIKINVGSNIDASNFKIMYHNKNIFSDEVVDTSKIDTGVIGEYYYIIDIPYGKNKSISKKVKIIIADTQSPSIQLQYKNGDKVSYTKDLTTEGYSVTDNYDKDIMSKVKVNIEQKNEKNIIVSYFAQDSSGNISESKVELEIIDDIAPSIALNGDENITINLHEEYNEQGAIAKDEIDGDLTENIVIDSDLDTNIVGKYVIKYLVIDSSGNKAEYQRYINVVDSKGVIYLTFDDGPSANITPKILDILKEKGIKATFFIVNYNENTEYLVKRIVQEGHTIGVHGYSHDYSKIYTSEDVFMDNIESLREKIKDSTDIDTRLIRFPGGSSNTVSKKYCSGIMTRLTKRVNEQGYRYFDWNVSSEDAGGAYTSTQVYNNVVNYLSKERANVVLMHDATDKVWTLNALEDIIDYGLSHGYKFSNITDDTPLVHHRINN